MSIKYSVIPVVLIGLIGCAQTPSVPPASHASSPSCTEKEAYEAGKKGFIYELYKCPEAKQHSLKLSYRLGGFDARRMAQ